MASGRKIGDAFVSVRPEYDKTTASTIRSESATIGKDAGGAFHGAFTNAVRGVAGVVGTLLAGQAVFGFIRDSIEEQRESIRVGNLTEQVIKSTGGAAKITADQVGDLATKLSNLSGVDDEVIQSGENVLLTFTNIKNGAGKNNDIFNQATAAALDLSTAMGSDLQSAVVQVGKALNDPIKGITALQKVGVTFDATQKEQIKNFVKAGDTMSAQKIILAELNKEFGGAAAAAADPAQKAQVAWGNLKEELGGALMPVLGTVVGFFTSKVMPAIQQFIGGLEGKGPIEGFAGVLNTAGLAVRALVTAFQEGDVTSDGFVGTMEKIGVILKDVWGWVSTTGLKIVKDLGSTLVELVGDIINVVTWFKEHKKVTEALLVVIGLLLVATKAHAAFLAVEAAGGLLKYLASMNLVQTATKVWTALQWLLNIAMDANPVGLIILAIGLLVAAILYLWTHSEAFRKFWIAAWEWIKSAAKAVGDWFAGPFADFFVGVWNKILAFIKTIGDFFFITLPAKVRGMAEKVVGFILSIHNYIVEKFTAIVNFVMSVPDKIWGFFKELPGKFLDLGKSIVQGIIDGISRMMGGLIDKAKDMATQAWNAVKNAIGFGSPAKKWVPLGRSMGQGAALGLDQSAKDVTDAARRAFRPPDGGDGSGTGGAMAGGRIERLLERIEAAVDRVAPGVGETINGTGTDLRRLNRAVS